MYRLPFYLILFILPLIGSAQNKLLNMEEAVVGQYRELYPKTMQNMQWQGDANTFTFQNYENLYQQKINKPDSTLLLTHAELNSMLTKAGLDSVPFIPKLSWENTDEFQFFYKTTWCAVSISKMQVIASIKLPDNAKNQSLNYEKKLLAFTIDNNLCLMGTDNKLIKITNNSNKNIVSGQAVSRNEFGIDGGIFWSPNSNFIAYYIKDESKVGNYPLVDITAREAKLKYIKYPMAGMSSENVSLGVYNLTTQKSVYIENQDTVSEKYLTNITWGPEEEYIYIQVLNRDQNHMSLNKYTVTDGSLKATLFNENNDKYEEPLHPLIFLNTKKDQFIYQTRNDGYNHAYLYSTDGKLIKQITKGSWEITDILACEGNNLYYVSTEASPLERHLYKINISSGKKVQLTHEPGVHRVILSDGNKYFIDNFSNIDLPRKIEITNTNGKLVRNVLKAENPLVDYNISKAEIGTIKAADGVTDLYYRLIKPIDFDSTKKYPAIVYVYGGPHAQMIEDNWLGGARMWNYLMAEKGYVMLTVDNRGSANRGLEFENVIHRQLGVNEMKDQMKGIELLRKLGFVDMNRIGVHGWSFGGFMTTSLMVNYPDVFKVGVAGGPVIDWKYYEVMYGERYMDRPEENPEGYLVTSLIPRAKDLKGKLLIIHGGVDPTVVPQNSQLFLRECIKNRIPVDFFTYPTAEHNVRGYDRIHLMDKVTQYFEDYLK